MDDLTTSTHDRRRAFLPTTCTERRAPEMPGGFVFGGHGPNAAAKMITIRLLLGRHNSGRAARRPLILITQESVS